MGSSSSGASRRGMRSSPPTPAFGLPAHEQQPGREHRRSGGVRHRQRHDERLLAHLLAQRVLARREDHPERDEEQNDAAGSRQRRRGDTESVEQIAPDEEESDQDDERDEQVDTRRVTLRSLQCVRHHGASMRLPSAGSFLLTLGVLVGAAASLGLILGFEPARLPPTLLNIAAYKLSFLAAFGLIAGGAIVVRYGRRGTSGEPAAGPLETEARKLPEGPSAPSTIREVRQAERVRTTPKAP